MNQHSVFAAGRTVRGHDRVELDGHWQDKAVVVIGMFADDIDAAGGGNDPARGPVKRFKEIRGNLSGKVI